MGFKIGVFYFSKSRFSSHGRVLGIYMLKFADFARSERVDSEGYMRHKISTTQYSENTLVITINTDYSTTQ